MPPGDQVWYVMAGDTYHGPYTVQELWHWFEAGRLSLDQMCIRDGSEGTFPLRQVLYQPVVAPIDPGRPRVAPAIDGAAQPSKQPVADAASLLSGSAPTPVDRGVRMLRSAVWLAAISVFGVVAAYGILKWTMARRDDQRAGRRVVQRAPRERPAEAVSPAELDRALRTEVSALLRDAETALNEGRFIEARRNWENVIEKCGNRSAFSSELNAAKRWIEWLDLTQHPEQRFVIEGSAVGPTTMIRIFDRRDQTDYRVRPGELFLEYRLDRYDADTNTAEISAGGQTFVIEGKPRF